jgi:hypothetical protein
VSSEQQQSTALTTIMGAVTPTLTSSQLYRDPTANPLGTTYEEVRSVYEVIYIQYHVDESPPTEEELEKENLVDILDVIGAVDIMLAFWAPRLGDSSSRTNMLATRFTQDDQMWIVGPAF